MKETFEYFEADYLGAPWGWLEARLENRLADGYEIRYDLEHLSWRGQLRPPQDL
jgi:hypothetical protein